MFVKRAVITFLPNEAKYTLSYNFFIYWFSSLKVKVDGSPGDDLHTFYPSEADAGYNVLNDPNSFR